MKRKKKTKLMGHFLFKDFGFEMVTPGQDAKTTTAVLPSPTLRTGTSDRRTPGKQICSEQDKKQATHKVDVLTHDVTLLWSLSVLLTFYMLFHCLGKKLQH